MEPCKRAFLVAVLLIVAGVGARGQRTPPGAPDASRFFGVWVVEMNQPAALKGVHTIRVWDNGGAVAASLQTNPSFPPIEATGVHSDGNMLVLTFGHEAKPHPIQENGQPIWVVVSVVVNDDQATVAQMLERSQTIKRGTGRRQP